MNRGKRMFLGAAAVFAALLLVAIWDISRRTTFPGSRKEGPLHEVPPDTSAGGARKAAPDSIQ